jgi:hypothetical protein
VKKKGMKKKKSIKENKKNGREYQARNKAPSKENKELHGQKRAKKKKKEKRKNNKLFCLFHPIVFQLI